MALCERIRIQVDPPIEDAPVDDCARLQAALETVGFTNAHISFTALKTIYPLVRNGVVDVTLVRHEDGCVVTAVSAAPEQFCVRAHDEAEAIGETQSELYGLAVDYGSTTILMQLIDIRTGKILVERTEANGQIVYGTDILTRITHLMGDKNGLGHLQSATANTFNTLLEQVQQASGISFTAANCPLMVISGNTTMQHFLLGLDAWAVFASPYAPIVMKPGFIDPRDVNIAFPGELYIIPGASNYVGGDIMSGLLTLGFYHTDETSLFFDVGTNGEMVVGNKDWLMAGAGAAGPALEGYISKYGLRAQPGAIDTVRIEGNKLKYTTIDNEKPIGICGSGIIDLLAEMRLAGWVGIDGSLNPDASSAIEWLDESEEYAAVYAPACESALGVDLYFSQTDIRQYLETKAAAHTMLDCMLDSTGLTEDDLQKLYLTGSFCAHANLESAITIGMFPDLDRSRYTGIRNSSLDGARTLLLDETKLDDLAYILDKIYCVQFASVPDFTIRMQAAKFIPHTNMNQYPYVSQKLRDRGVTI